MKQWVWRGLIGGAALALGGFLVAASGVISIKASSGHWPLTEWVLRFSMKRSIATHSLGVKPPPDLGDPALIVKGARHYELGCRFCHGEPGLPSPPAVNGMLPHPPDLGPRVRESDPEKLFTVVKHGIKFTGMPAWPSQQRDDEVWEMVAFLLKYPELDGESYRRLARPEPSAALPSRPVPAAVRSCMACHESAGAGAEAEAAFPRLSGQHAEYLHNTLTAYAEGRRHSGTMQPVAAALDEAARMEIVRHYAGQPRAKKGNDETDTKSDAVERGRIIAELGIPQQRVPACIECHGPGARRGKPEYPALAGQPAGYLERQLKLFKEEQRGGTAYAHLMKPVASRLTPEQAGDVAAYFEALGNGVP
jgi:cytochrome c553